MEPYQHSEFSIQYEIHEEEKPNLIEDPDDLRDSKIFLKRNKERCIVVDDYLYDSQQEHEEIFTWKCSKMKELGCTVEAITFKSNPKKAKINGIHKHSVPFKNIVDRFQSPVKIIKKKPAVRPIMRSVPVNLKTTKPVTATFAVGKMFGCASELKQMMANFTLHKED